MLVTLVLAVTVCLMVAVVVGLAMVVVAVRCEDRHMTLKDAPITRLEAATRRLLGVGVRQPEDKTHTIQAGRR